MTRDPSLRLTYEDYLRLPEGRDYEILEGELRMVPAPSPAHQRIVGRLYYRLFSHVEAHGSGEVLVAPVDVILAQDTVVQPDVLFVAAGRKGIIDPGTGVFGAPDLVVEVLSPSRPDIDRVVKRKLYGQYGVREYWIVDPTARTVAVYAGGPHGMEPVQTCSPGTPVTSRVLPDLHLDPAHLFPDGS